MAANEHLYPFAGNNAIKACVFALDLEQEFTDAELRRVVELSDEMKRLGLPDRKEINVVQVQGQIDGSALPVVSKKTGYQFVASNLGNNHVLRQLHLAGEQCFASIHNYTRWFEAKPTAIEYLKRAVSAMDAEKKISSATLQYNDAFIWNGAKEDFEAGVVLNRNSAYVPDFVINCRNQVWHSFSGIAVSTELLPAMERIDNINISLADENGKYVLSIVASHRYKFSQPYPKASELIDLAIPNMFEEAHEANKRLMRDILAPEVQGLIALK